MLRQFSFLTFCFLMLFRPLVASEFYDGFENDDWLRPMFVGGVGGDEFGVSSGFLFGTPPFSEAADFPQFPNSQEMLAGDELPSVAERAKRSWKDVESLEPESTPKRRALDLGEIHHPVESMDASVPQAHAPADSTHNSASPDADAGAVSLGTEPLQEDPNFQNLQAHLAQVLALPEDFVSQVAARAEGAVVQVLDDEDDKSWNEEDSEDSDFVQSDHSMCPSVELDLQQKQHIVEMFQNGTTRKEIASKIWPRVAESTGIGRLNRILQEMGVNIDFKTQKPKANRQEITVALKEEIVQMFRSGKSRKAIANTIWPGVAEGTGIGRVNRILQEMGVKVGLKTQGSKETRQEITAVLKEEIVKKFRAGTLRKAIAKEIWPGVAEGTAMGWVNRILQEMGVPFEQRKLKPRTNQKLQ